MSIPQTIASIRLRLRGIVAWMIGKWREKQDKERRKMNVERLKDWLFNGDIGISSLTMASALMGVKYFGANQPFDIMDFKRCHDFTEYVEMNGEDFLKVVETYPWWQHFQEI